ncbi:SDR family NAD(P)-dependent oxidoreductase [Saccharomonospora sp. NPDC046836]|uniref:SDR family NAD(P)-dependent oxidoreductase n=1 Tax=Saccharomonospora sp. NPDC046836 TaxID=3156921 RepID=UPI0033F21D20
MDFSGKIAFITGAANGAGLGQAHVFGRAGCRLFLVDIRADALATAIEQLRAEGIEAEGCALDLTDRVAYARVADRVEEVYGEPPHLLFNTAGVFAIGPTEMSRYEDFDWVLGVNLGGVVNGMVTLVPRMIDAGRPGHIVTTASVGGFYGADAVAIYSASKAAVINLMEGYRKALAKYRIGVSVLCPMNINSNIGLSSQVRPAQLRASGYVVDDATTASLQGIFAHGMDPLELAGHVKAGIERNDLYIIPYPEAAVPVRQHVEDILAAIPATSTDPDGVASRTAALENWARDRDEIARRRSDQAPGRVVRQRQEEAAR